MATSLDTLIRQTRRFLRDYPLPVDALTASITTTATSLTISDTSAVGANWPLEIDQETFLVRTVSNGTTLTVARAFAGSTAAVHASAATVLFRPAFYATEIIDALNSGMSECYPYIYREVTDTSLTGAANTYEFAVPNMPGTYGGDTIPIPALSRIWAKLPGDFAYREVNDWGVIRDATAPVIQFRRPPGVGSTLRVVGFGPFPDMIATSDTVTTSFPRNSVQALVLCAASRLLSSGEAGRSRQDVGARDDREAANKPGNAISLANQLERRFEKDLARAAMPPMPKHVNTAL